MPCCIEERTGDPRKNDGEHSLSKEKDITVKAKADKCTFKLKQDWIAEDNPCTVNGRQQSNCDTTWNEEGEGWEIRWKWDQAEIDKTSTDLTNQLKQEIDKLKDAGRYYTSSKYIGSGGGNRSGSNPYSGGPKFIYYACVTDDYVRYKPESQADDPVTSPDGPKPDKAPGGKKEGTTEPLGNESNLKNSCEGCTPNKTGGQTNGAYKVGEEKCEQKSDYDRDDKITVKVSWRYTKWIPSC